MTFKSLCSKSYTQVAYSSAKLLSDPSLPGFHSYNEESQRFCLSNVPGTTMEKVPNSHFTDVETVALSLETTPKYKCGPLKTLSMSCDPAALAMADLAKRFFRIFQIGNKENTRFLSGSKAVRCVSYFVEEAGLRERC